MCCERAAGNDKLPLEVAIQRLPSAAGLDLPRYQSAHSAGMDLVAAEPAFLGVGSRAAVATGLSLAIPAGYEGQVRPRSGLALAHGITVANAPGTIDADYRGEIKVILVNLGHVDFTVNRGDRIAQLVIAPVTTILWKSVETLPTSDRGTGGFGSTGGFGTPASGKP